MNFDTALGAAVTSLFIAKYIGSVIPGTATSALILAVLAIYNFDHLLDAKQIEGNAISGRHLFYQQNFKALSVFQLILLIALLPVSWFVPAIIVKAGIILAIVALIYFLLLFIVLPNRFAFKEIIIAGVFVCGVFLAPIATSSSQTISLDIIFLSLQIFLLALANTFIFSWFDYEHDLKEAHTSLAQILGKKIIYQLSFVVLGSLAIIIALRMINDANWPDQLIIASMGMVLLLTLILKGRIHRRELYRIAGEAIFLIPIVGLL